jgi:peptidoglycan/LPS O-acetylase OafA/YrhL
LLLRAFAGLGVVSYGIYLWHWLVIHGIEIAAGRAAPFGGALGTPIAIAVSLAATLPLAMISWYIVESPCMRLATAVARRPVADIPASALELGVARASAAPEAR